VYQCERLSEVAVKSIQAKKLYVYLRAVLEHCLVESKRKSGAVHLITWGITDNHVSIVITSNPADNAASTYKRIWKLKTIKPSNINEHQGE
jgi:hypothetical protein